LVDAETLEAGWPCHLTLRETAEVRGGLTWLMDHPEVPQRIHLGTLLADVAADLFAIPSVAKDRLASIGRHPILTEEQCGVRRQRPWLCQE
jgi:hypothetical protein